MKGITQNGVINEKRSGGLKMSKEQNTKMVYTDHGKKKALGKLVKIGEHEQTALAYVEKNRVVGYKFLDEIVRDSYIKDIPKCDIDL